jgi:hypothetical protein
VPTLELIKTAVLNDELDTQIEAAANKLRDGMGLLSKYSRIKKALECAFVLHRPVTRRSDYGCHSTTKPIESTPIVVLILVQFDSNPSN